MAVTATTSVSSGASRSRGRGRPRSGGGEQLRRDVIAAAWNVYAEHGYTGCTVARLTAAAKVSRPTFYKLFNDRHEVVDLVVARANAELKEQIVVAISGSSSLLTGVRDAIDAYFDWCLKTGPIVGRIYSEIGDSESPASGHRQRAIVEFVEFMQSEAKRHGLPDQQPLFYDSLVRVVENCGSQSVWPQRKTATEIADNKSVAISIVMAAARTQS